MILIQQIGIMLYLSTITYLKVNPLIMSHVPMKKLNKQQLEFIQKPWFTKAMQNSIQKKKLIKNTF